MNTPTSSEQLSQHQPIPPELLAWVQQTFDKEEFLKEIREIETTGGRTFESVIAEVQAMMEQS
jgi:hypothetical protein